MTTTLEHQARLYTSGAETSFPLPDSPAVTVAPLLRHEEGHAVDAFFLTIPAATSVPREQHPFSETLIPAAGALTVSLGDGEPTTVLPGQVFYIPADCVHYVENRGTEPAIATMIIGA